MIRHRNGNDWLLFTQDDHARLSGALAARIGGGPIAKPSARAIEGIGLHDCGWPIHDDCPTLNASGDPLHVFETPPSIAVRVWSESVSRAAGRDPYCGLLVSLHALNLSAMSMAWHRTPHQRFELNKFQHRQVEIQEDLRRRLGLPVDLPLTYGLAPPGTNSREDELLFDYRLLRAMDQLSLALLCAEPLFDSLEGVCPAPGGQPRSIRLTTPAAFTLQMEPSPFDADRIELQVPTRRLVARTFADDEDFRQAYAQAHVESVAIRVTG